MNTRRRLISLLSNLISLFHPPTDRLRRSMVFAVAFVFAPSPWVACSAVALSTDGPDIVLTGTTYRMALSKSNGAIKRLSDATNSRVISEGSRNECLWGLLDSADQYNGGCLHSPDSAERTFSYSTDTSTNTIFFTYRSGPGTTMALTARVTVEAFEDSVVMRLSLTNASPNVIRKVLFPSDVVFQKSTIEDGYIPSGLPGVRIGPTFFSEGRSFYTTYPSVGMFMDFIALRARGVLFSIHAINAEPNPISPVHIGLFNDTASLAFLGHEHVARVAPGGEWHGPAYRVRIGRDVMESIDSYRRDNQIETFSSVDDKLSRRRLSALTSATMVKYSPAAENQTFSEVADFFSGLEHRVLVHLGSYWNVGFDRNYPDFLPPNPVYGTTPDFARLGARLRQKGNLLMPYINPTWWQEDSPTVLALSNDAARGLWVLNASGEPRRETYGENGGYVPSPTSPLVQQRVDQLMQSFQADVQPDCIFEDQIGARSWVEDFNPTASGPGSYADAWLAHTRQYGDRCLMTEMGWDRLAASELGFHGSPYVPFVRGLLDNSFGPGNWEDFPIAPTLFGDKVLWYHHNLEALPITKGVITYNMAFGAMFSITDWFPTEKIVPQLEWAGPLQERVLSRIAGHRVISFSRQTDRTSLTDYGDIKTFANFGTSPSAFQSAVVAPGGFATRSTNGDLVAGIFQGDFNGVPLSAGEHTIIIDSHASAVDVVHKGPDSPINVVLWSLADLPQVRVRALDGGRQLISEGLAPVVNSRVNIDYHQTINARRVAFVRISAPPLAEPSLNAFALPRPEPLFPNCPGGYFVAVIDDGPGPGLSPGIFGLDLTLQAPGTLRLEGGLNFGGLLDGSQVAFAGFNVQNSANEPQRLHLVLNGNPTGSQSAALQVQISIIRQPSAGINETVYQSSASLSLATAFMDSLVIQPGYHVVTIAPLGAASSPGGAADGQVFVSLSSQFTDRPGGGFFGGVVVGGYHAAAPFGDNSGFASFCLGSAHSVAARVLSAPTYGATGARDLRLRLLDHLGNVVVSSPD